MKLTIKNGESIENALQYLRDYLEKYKEDYPMLKGNMNVYVTLEGFGHKACPDNEREMILTGEQPVDVEASHILAKQKEALEGWKRYISVQYKKVRKASDAVDLDMRYLETAEEKDRKPDAIARRKEQLKQNERLLDKAEQTASLMMLLDARVDEGSIRWYFEKRKSSGSSYAYTITPYIIFEDVDGEDWHFVGFESRYEQAYGSVRPGLPTGYRRQEE